MVRVPVVYHRMGDPTLFLEPVVGAPSKLGYRMMSKELGRQTLGGRPPRQSLRAILAKDQRVGVSWGRVRPCATRAFEATGLIHKIERGTTLKEHPLL